MGARESLSQERLLQIGMCYASSKWPPSVCATPSLKAAEDFSFLALPKREHTKGSSLMALSARWIHFCPPQRWQRLPDVREGTQTPRNISSKAVVCVRRVMGHEREVENPGQIPSQGSFLCFMTSLHKSSTWSWQECKYVKQIQEQMLCALTL